MTNYQPVMMSALLENRARRLFMYALGFLVIAATLGLLAETARPSHSHESGTPGLYNAECPLQLAAHHIEGVAASLLSSMWAGFTAALSPVIASARRFAPPSFDFDSRAPPLV
jgi:hypothetical protein